jgi:hypothetical protein
LTIATLLSVAQGTQAETRRHYINKYVMMVDWLTRTEMWVTTHLDDLELCRWAHAVAERHVELAQRMTPPSELAAVHPHFLLAMENAERMFDNAAAGDRKAYRRHRRIVREEFRLVAELLQANSIYLPTMAP